MSSKIFWSSFLMSLSYSSLASTLAVMPGQQYVGREVIEQNMMEHETGKTCYVNIVNVAPIAKGKHCYAVDMQFLSPRPEVTKDVLTVMTRVTNYHRPEYPATKTCAMNVDGTTYGDEIYGDNTDVLFNDILGGMTKGHPRLDYFLTISRQTKMAVRTRMHLLYHLKEYSVDCVNLKLLNGPQAYDVFFENENVTAKLKWIKGPKKDVESQMLITFLDSDKKEVDLNSKLDVELFMPSMGHGSSPVKIEQATDSAGNLIKGSYLVKEMYFTMGGLWEVKLSLTDKNGNLEQRIYSINLFDKIEQPGDGHGH